MPDKMPLFLFCANPLHQRFPDDVYLAEVEAAHRAGAPCALVSYDDFCEGLIFRQYVELAPLAIHSKSGMPLAVEYRVFVLDGKPIAVTPYLLSGRRPPVGGWGCMPPRPWPLRRVSRVLYCLYAPCQQNRVCRFRAQSFARVKALAYLDVVLVREAEAAHSTSSVLNETNLMAVGQHSIGARP